MQACNILSQTTVLQNDMSMQLQMQTLKCTQLMWLTLLLCSFLTQSRTEDYFPTLSKTNIFQKTFMWPCLATNPELSPSIAVLRTTDTRPFWTCEDILDKNPCGVIFIVTTTKSLWCKGPVPAGPDFFKCRSKKRGNSRVPNVEATSDTFKKLLASMRGAISPRKIREKPVA